MKNLLKRHIGKLFLITILCIIFWVINLFTNQYNPYANFLTLFKPEKFLVKDIFIVQKNYSWGGSSNSPEVYSFYGYLIDESPKKIYDLFWGNIENVPWEIFSDTLLNNKKFKFTPVYKSKIQDYSIYPIKDPTYMRDEIIEDFLSCIFFSIPFLTVPFFIYLFYLGYLERKQEKKETKNNTFRNNIYDPFQ